MNLLSGGVFLLLILLGQKIEIASAKINNAEYGIHFQGDVLRQRQLFKSVLNDSKELWPNGTVYYKFGSDFPDEHEQMILEAMKVIEGHNKCVQFKKHEDENNNHHVIIQDGPGCSSSIGRISQAKMQYLYLEETCFTLGTIVHELLHCLGFYHEHVRPDRDDYIEVNLNNVYSSAVTVNFNKVNDWIEYLKYPYDYDSIMHYSSTAFAKEDRHSIEPRKKNVRIGQRVDLSEIDIQKLKDLYNCTITKRRIKKRRRKTTTTTESYDELSYVNDWTESVEMDEFTITTPTTTVISNTILPPVRRRRIKKRRRKTTTTTESYDELGYVNDWTESVEMDEFTITAPTTTTTVISNTIPPPVRRRRIKKRRRKPTIKNEIDENARLSNQETLNDMDEDSTRSTKKKKKNKKMRRKKIKKKKSKKIKKEDEE